MSVPGSNEDRITGVASAHEKLEYNKADPAEFRMAAAACGQPCVILALGGRYESLRR